MKKPEKRTPEDILSTAKNVAFYGRVSTKEQSVDARQKEVVIDYLKSRGKFITEEYSDEISGYSKSYKKRDNFPRLLEDLEKGKIDAVVVSDRDRISRQTTEHFALRKELEKLGVPIVIASRDELYQHDDFIRNLIEDSLTKFESDTISNRTKATLQTLREKKQYIGGKPPFGYRPKKVEDVRKGKRDHSLVVAFEAIPEEIELVRLIFMRYQNHHTLTSIAKELETFVVAPEEKGGLDGKVWTRNKVKSILLNPIYTGHLVYNRYSDERGVVYKSMDEWVWYPCELIEKPVMSLEEWLYCWHLYSEREKYHRHTNSSFTLNHLLVCHCGEKMIGKDQRTNQKGKGGVYGYRYYICPQKSCKQKIVSDKIEYEVMEEVFKHHSLTHLVSGLVKERLQQELEASKEMLTECTKIIHDEEMFLLHLNRSIRKVENEDVVLHSSVNQEVLAVFISKRLSEDRIEAAKLLRNNAEAEQSVLRKLLNDEQLFRERISEFVDTPFWTKLNYAQLKKLLRIVLVECRLTSSSSLSIITKR